MLLKDIDICGESLKKYKTIYSKPKKYTSE